MSFVALANWHAYCVITQTVHKVLQINSFPKVKNELICSTLSILSAPCSVFLFLIFLAFAFCVSFLAFWSIKVNIFENRQH